MRVKYLESIGCKVWERIKSIRENVFLRQNFNDLGSYRQVSRALDRLIAQKKIVRIGAGVYAKAYLSPYSDIPLIKGGIDAALREALKCLDIIYESGSLEEEYNTGKSTQIPIRNIVRLKKRCRRQIGYQNSKLFFENNINAK